MVMIKTIKGVARKLRSKLNDATEQLDKKRAVSGWLYTASVAPKEHPAAAAACVSLARTLLAAWGLDYHDDEYYLLWPENEGQRLHLQEKAEQARMFRESKLKETDLRF